MEPVVDEDLHNVDDEDDPTDAELEERAAAAAILNSLEYQEEVNAVAESFQSTMEKLRETAKVRIVAPK